MRGQDPRRWAMQEQVRTGQAALQISRGKSTGPKAPEGKASIAEAQRRRWADDFRAGKLADDGILALLFRLNQERAAK